MTARPIKSAELLDLAETLVPADAGRGRPKTVWLRRAVSTAYYSLFHHLVHCATVELCGDGPVCAEQRRHMARWLGHTDIAVLAGAVVAANPTGPQRAIRAVMATAPHPDLVRVAGAFLRLQAARHEADYDHTYDVKRSDARLLIATAGDAIRRIDSLEQRDDPSYRQFLRLMVGAVKIAKSR